MLVPGIFVYYMLPTRAGELPLGAIALAVLKQAKVPRIAIISMALAGTVLLMVPLFLFSEEQAFPGWRAIPPTLGTALLIYARYCRDNFVSRALAFRPLVWIGLVSYSAYLWHWPLIAFFRYGHREVGLLAGSVMIALTFLLAWMNYRYVEQPARHSRGSAFQIFSRQYVLPAGALALVCLVAMKTDGYAFRWPSTYRTDLLAVREQTRPAYDYDYVCQRQRVAPVDVANPRCVIGKTSTATPTTLLWGDSNAAHYIGMVGVFAQKVGFRFRNIALGSCPPIAGDPMPFVAGKRVADCRHSAKVLMPWSILST